MKKTPHTRQSIGVFKEQLDLIPTPLFSPIWPIHTILTAAERTAFLDRIGVEA